MSLRMVNSSSASWPGACSPLVTLLDPLTAGDPTSTRFCQVPLHKMENLQLLTTYYKHQIPSVLQETCFTHHTISVHPTFPAQIPPSIYLWIPQLLCSGWPGHESSFVLALICPMTNLSETPHSTLLLAHSSPNGIPLINLECHTAPAPQDIAGTFVGRSQQDDAPLPDTTQHTISHQYTAARDTTTST